MARNILNYGKLEDLANLEDLDLDIDLEEENLSSELWHNPDGRQRIPDLKEK